MTEKPIIIKQTNHNTRTQQADLQFAPQFFDENLVLREYRQKAWKTYLDLPLPNGKEEDWRRTSLKGIDFSTIKTIDPDIYPEVVFPSWLLNNVAGEKLGAQLLLSPVNSHLTMGESHC